MALVAMLMLSSCAEDQPVNAERPGDSGRIFFRSHLPSVSLSRAADVTALSTCQVTCFNPDDNTLINPVTGEMTPYFTDICCEDDGTGRFFSTGNDGCVWPGANSTIHFFAYYPSVESMKKISGDTLFNLVNYSNLTDGAQVLDYRLEKFRVSPDIASQTDFLAAYSSGSYSTDGETGIGLDFRHQLARVELTAWGANDKYDFEIAGARIGNPFVEGDFNFSALASSSDDVVFWRNISGHQSPVEYIFNPGETVVRLSKSEESHDTEDKVASIMGKAGAAMVIPTPTKIEAWEGKDDPATASPGYFTDKMYFSVLMRVKNSDGEVVYPYPNSHDKMTIVFFAMAKDSGSINKRLYKIDGAWYTTPGKSDESLYTPADSEEICGFSWAALPVPAKWDVGKKYTYKLNYSNGIGWHDPTDHEPGEPIIERGHIPFSVSVDDWLPADNYTSDIDVPRK